MSGACRLGGLLLAWVGLLAPGGCTSEEATPDVHTRGMNLVLITLDTTRADHMSFLGADPRLTPNLSILARRSSVFERAWSETNATNPSHLSILTGQRAIGHGVFNNETPFPPDLDSLPLALQRAGYRNAAFIAVRHLGLDWPGFDVQWAAPGEAAATEVTDRALRWLARFGHRRFFLWVHYFDPHTIYAPPRHLVADLYQGDPEAGEGPPIVRNPFFRKMRQLPTFTRWLRKTRDPAYPRALYAGEIRYTDLQLGRLLARLEQRGLDERTVVIVVADHGESLDEHGLLYSHTGLYEPQLRVPLIVHVPGVGPERVAHPATTLDVAPTVVGLLGLELNHPLPGLALVAPSDPRARRRLRERRVLVHQNAHNHGVAIREGDWKLIWPLNASHPVLSPYPELFDLSRDPREQQNLAFQEPERLQALREQIEPWVALGIVHPQEPEHLDEKAREQLRALGYIGY